MHVRQDCQGHLEILYISPSIRQSISYLSTSSTSMSEDVGAASRSTLMHLRQESSGHLEFWYISPSFSLYFISQHGAVRIQAHYNPIIVMMLSLLSPGH